MPPTKRHRTKTANAPKPPSYTIGKIMEIINTDIYLGNKLYYFNKVLKAPEPQINAIKEDCDKALQDVITMIKNIRKKSPVDADAVNQIYQEFLHNNHPSHGPLSDSNDDVIPDE